MVNCVVVCDVGLNGQSLCVVVKCGRMCCVTGVSCTESPLWSNAGYPGSSCAVTYYTAFYCTGLSE